MFSIDNYVNCDLKPSEAMSSQWLYEYKAEIAEKYTGDGGKWMQFYDKSQLDMMWDYAKAKYRAGSLEGIKSMKVSTFCYNPRASSFTDGVILFYCGPVEDAEKIIQYGYKLVEEMLYRNPSGWMSYKSDEQTSAGTRATGQKHNYLYRIPCPKT